MTFFNFFVFFFGNSLSQVLLEPNSNRKFFSLLLGLSLCNLDINNARMIFFNFFNFIAIFLGILYSGSSRNEIRNKNFIVSFLAYLNPVWIEIMLE